MPYLVAHGATLQCSQGMAPGTLVVTPRAFAADQLLLANIHDFQPMSNIMPFGMCQSMANPQVQAATVAAMGVLTPQPCIPVITGPWAPGSQFMSQNVGKGASLPVVTSTCRCMGAYAGDITIVNANCTVKIDG